MKRIKVLVVIAGFNFGVSGGVASVLYNYSKYISHEKFDIDYLALGYQGFEPYRSELESYGSSLYCLNITEHGWKRLIQSISGIRAFLKENHYEVIHCNSGSMRQVLMMAIGARSSKARVIVHSHSAMRMSILRKKIYGLISNLFLVYADQFVACSEMAARSMFPKPILSSGNWFFLPNAIEPERFAYDEEKRDRMRKQLSIKSSTVVIGHVGRMNYTKNHEFLLKVFDEYHKINDDSVLLLVGDGDLRERLEKQADALGIADKVIFTGQRRDANDVMQAMDVFVFPSLYEGLGISVIESQAIGLPTIASNTLPLKETNITEIIEYLPLGNAKLWGNRIAEISIDYNRRYFNRYIKKAGYDIKDCSRILDMIYLNELDS